MTKILTDRSRFLEFQRCPRARYWAYEYAGRGVAPVKQSETLIGGRAVHAGVAKLLQGADVDAAVATALADHAQGADPMRGEDNPASIQNTTLIEAMIRDFTARGLRQVLSQYVVLDVEREELLPMGLVKASEGEAELVWMGRPDALLRERGDGDLYVFSLKTAARLDPRLEHEYAHDTQGLSEIAAVEHRTGENVMGVQMVILLKQPMGLCDRAVMPPPYFRERREVEDWFEQAIAKEARVAAASAACATHLRPSSGPC